MKANNDEYFPFRLKYKAKLMVLISYGNSEISVHVKNYKFTKNVGPMVLRLDSNSEIGAHLLSNHVRNMF